MNLLQYTYIQKVLDTLFREKDVFFKCTNYKYYDSTYKIVQEKICYLFLGKSHLLTADKSTSKTMAAASK